MTHSAARFYQAIKSSLKRETDLPDFFIYHLTVDLNEPQATTKAIRECYEACDLSPPSWLPSILSTGLKSKPKRFIKRTTGYRLESGNRDRISAIVGVQTPSVQTSAALNRLEALVPDGPKREFLHETIDCFNVGANRAALIMCWNLTLHHLQEYVFTKHLGAFNTVLAANTDRRVKVTSVSKLDDFTDMPESKFIEFCRTAKVITAGLHNKLKNRLDERNSAAHPSGVKTPPKLAEAFIEDLVENVIQKFAI